MSSLNPIAPLPYRHDHPAVQPHEFHRQSRTLRSLRGKIDNVDRESWFTPSSLLLSKTSTLRSLYNMSDVLNDPHISPLLHPPKPHHKSKLDMLLTSSLSVNKNVVLNERGFYGDKRRKESFITDDRGVGRLTKTAEIGIRSKTVPSKYKPFYGPGRSTVKLRNREVVRTEKGEVLHAREQDLNLSFDEGLHSSIDVSEDPVDGVNLGWPSIGVESLVGNGREGEGARRGMCDVWGGRVDEYEKVNPSSWDVSGYPRGSILDKGGGESEIRIPRGVARSIEREGVRNARVHKMALDKRRGEAKKHGRWLQGKSTDDLDSQNNNGNGNGNGNNSMMLDESLYTQYNPSISNATSNSKSKKKKKKKPNQFKKNMSTYGSLASSHLSLTGGPNGNPFRSKMSTSLGSLETTASYANTYSIMKTLSQASQNASSLIGAVAKGEKSTRLTNVQKLDCLAVFGLVLLKAPNNSPGQTTVLELGTALATTAASNPDPNLISRSQFTSVLMSHLDHVTPLNCANLFSTFDPNGRGRLNHLSFLCTLLSIHRPSMNNMMSGSYHYCRDNVKSVTVLSRCVQVVERGRGGVTLKDLKLILKGCCLKAEDRRAIDVQIDQISTVLKRPFEKFSRPVVLTEDEILGPNGLLIRNSFVLDVFQEQLLHMQEEVSGRQGAIKRK